MPRFTGFDEVRRAYGKDRRRRRPRLRIRDELVRALLGPTGRLRVGQLDFSWVVGRRCPFRRLFGNELVVLVGTLPIGGRALLHLRRIQIFGLLAFFGIRWASRP